MLPLAQGLQAPHSPKHLPSSNFNYLWHGKYHKSIQTPVKIFRLFLHSLTSYGCHKQMDTHREAFLVTLFSTFLFYSSSPLMHWIAKKTTDFRISLLLLPCFNGYDGAGILISSATVFVYGNHMKVRNVHDTITRSVSKCICAWFGVTESRFSYKIYQHVS